MKHIKSINELVGEISINDMIGYLDKMSYGMQDKLFFLGKIDFDCVVDFGAADGTMLSNIKKSNPSIHTIGYEIDNNMINILNDNDYVDYVTNNIGDVFTRIKYYNNPILVLSSVVHEIYSYSRSDKEVDAFWQSMFNSNFKHIVIRDMVSMEEFYETKPNEEDVNKVREKANPKLLSSFEQKWGSIDENYNNLIHFLLKYKYENNWEREVNENYLQLTIEKFKSLIPNNWTIQYENHFVLEYMKGEIRKDFNVNITKPTHMKVIIRKL